MPNRGDSPYARLDELLRGPEGEKIRSLDVYLQAAEPTGTLTVLTTDTSSLYRIGSITTDTDREFRRAAAILGQGPFEGYKVIPPRPIHPVYGGLLVRDARAGSLHLLVEAYGEVQKLIFSRPVSALVVVATLGGVNLVTLRAWLHRPKSVDSGEQPRDTLTEAREDAGRALEEEPDQQLDFQGPVAPSPVPGVSIIEAEDEVYVQGREIIHIRNRPDGTQDIIYVRS